MATDSKALIERNGNELHALYSESYQVRVVVIPMSDEFHSTRYRLEAHEVINNKWQRSHIDYVNNARFSDLHCARTAAQIFAYSIDNGVPY